MKIVKIVAVVFIIFCGWQIAAWLNRQDANDLIWYQQRIQECKDMGGHPVLYYHNGYKAWLLETCKL